MQTKEVILPVLYVTTTTAEHSHQFNLHINSSFLFIFEVLKPAHASELLLIDERGIVSLNCAHSIPLCINWKIHRHNVYQILW
jgi:hypothetical protein